LTKGEFQIRQVLVRTATGSRLLHKLDVKRPNCSTARAEQTRQLTT